MPGSAPGPAPPGPGCAAPRRTRSSPCSPPPPPPRWPAPRSARPARWAPPSASSAAIGSNYLADTLAGTAHRLRDTDPSPERWRDEVAADLRERLEAGDERAAALRDEVTAVLHAVDAVDVALRAADADLRKQLVGAFGALGEDVGRLHQLGEDALRVARRHA